MKNPSLALSTTLAFGLLAPLSQAATVLATADAELTESAPNTDGTAAVSGGSGIGASMNYRWSGDAVAPGATTSNRNDITAIRFDLGSYDLASVQAVSLSLTSFRAGTLNPAKIYGMAVAAIPTTGAYTASDWSESAISFNTMPGLTYDGLSTTQGLNLGQLTELGTLSSAAVTKGQIITFSSAALTSFINSYGGTSVTFLIAGNAELTGQTRFATKDATSLDTDPVGTVPAGTYAPTLTFTGTLVPEPSSLLLTAFAGLALAFRRRI